MAHVAIVGGGVTGLATAALLARDGHRVEIYEQGSEVGGRARRWRSQGFTFDLGPSWYLMPEVFDHFFRLCGTSTDERLDLVGLDPAYRVFFEGRPDALDVSTGRPARMAFEAIEPGAGAQLDRYLASARKTYDLALDAFLYTTWQRLPAGSFQMLPRLAGLLGRSLDSFIRRRFRDQRLRQILGYPAVFLGTSPRSAPALYHLMSHCDLDQGVAYPRGGFGAVVGALADLAREAGAQIVTDARVTSVRTAPSGRRARVTGVEVTSCGKTRFVPADVVVGAGDLHDLETRLVPADLQTYPPQWWRGRDPGPGAVLVHLGVRGRVPQLAHHSLFFTADWHANFDAIYSRRVVPDPGSMYVCAPSRTDSTVAPEGDETLFLLVPVPADAELGGGGEDGSGSLAVEQIADRAITQLATWADIPDLRGRIVVRRTVGPGDFATELSAWSGGALGPAHTLRQSALFRGRNASRHIDGLLYAGGSTIPGIGLPMCLISAELIVKRLHGDVSATPLAEPVRVAVR